MITESSTPAEKMYLKVLKGTKLILSDLDGCFTRSNGLIRNSTDMISLAHQLRIPIRFITSNTAKSPEDFATKLSDAPQSQGSISPSDVFTPVIPLYESINTSRAAIHGLQQQTLEDRRHSRGYASDTSSPPRIYLIGSSYIRAFFENKARAGECEIVSAKEVLDERHIDRVNVDCVAVGWDEYCRTSDWKYKVDAAAKALFSIAKSNLSKRYRENSNVSQYFITSLDRKVPRDAESFDPGPGAHYENIESVLKVHMNSDARLRKIDPRTVGIYPTIVGKPDPWLARMALAKANVDATDALVLGDGETDIAVAKRLGIYSIHVQGGASSLAELKANDLDPDYSVKNVHSLAEEIRYKGLPFLKEGEYPHLPDSGQIVL